MAYRLGDYVTYGELFTTKHYGVYGFVVLRTEEGEAGGEHTFVRLELTGDPDPDLRGMHICFEPEEGSDIKYFRKSEHKDLKLQQYGATGTMTAQGWVRSLPCSVEEYLTRSRLGEPPPTTWKRHLYLEWFGPNGRMLIELAGPLVEVCTRESSEEDDSDEGEWEPLLNLAPHPEPYVLDPGNDADFEITAINEAGEIETITGSEYMDGENLDFHRVLERESCSYEYHDGGDDELEELMAETRLMDECMEELDETPLIKLLGGIDDLPHPDDLDDEAAEVQLKVLLGRMALLGVALSVCEHCTPRDTYRMLLEKILPDSGAFEALIGTGWVQHFMTDEYCEQCEAELEEEPESPVWN